jgi:hypothetical protein
VQRDQSRREEAVTAAWASLIHTAASRDRASRDTLFGGVAKHEPPTREWWMSDAGWRSIAQPWFERDEAVLLAPAAGTRKLMVPEHVPGARDARAAPVRLRRAMGVYRARPPAHRALRRTLP